MNSYTHYIILTIGTLAASFLSAKWSVSRSWLGVFIAGIIFNITWATCAKYTNRLLFDSFLYSLFITLFYYTSLIMFMNANGLLNSLRWYNWAGVFMAIIGLFLFKMKL